MIQRPLSEPQHPHAPRESILVADDDAAMRNYLRRLLEPRWEVRIAEDGAGAFAAAHASIPDLVLAEVSMPLMGGYELLKELRADGRTAMVPVILLSAPGDERAGIEGMSAGADDYMVKPFGPRELVARVAARLEIARLRRESEKRIQGMLDTVTEAEEFMRSAAESALVWAWDVDLVNGIVKYSENVAPIFGYEKLPQAFYSAADSLSFVHPEDAARVRQAIERAIGEAGPLHVEYRASAADGKILWIEANGKVVRDANGKPARMVGIAQNVTERKRIEEERARGEGNAQFLNRLDLDLAPLADTHDIVRLATRRLGEFLGVTRCYVSEAGLGRDVRILPGDWRREGLASLAGPHPLRDAIPAEYRACADAGHSIAVDDVGHEPALAACRDQFAALDILAFVVVPYVSGKGWEASLVLTRDETHHWRSDELQLVRDVAARAWPAVKRVRAERALRESEERFRMMADSSPVLIWATDARGRLEFANRTYLDFFGIPTLDKAADFDWRQMIHAEDRDACVAAFAATMRERLPLLARMRMKRRDGAWRWLELRGNPRIDALGQVTGVIGSSPDITEIFESRESLREADRRKDEFLAMLAHELRNPLAPIVNAMRALRRLTPAEPQLDNVRDVIERQTEQLTRLVDDLLDVSRITQGRIALRKESIELLTLVGRAVETSRPLIDARHHQLVISVPTEPVRIEGDLARLAQVLSNLLNNAAKYTDDGGSIRLAADVKEGEAVVCVQDNGIGIAADELPHVFELFTQAKHSLDRAQGGLGIGLTLVRSLVGMHGGRVEARSAGVGKGSEFVIHLPLAAAAPRHEKALKPPRSPVEARSRSRVLVVDDNVDSATSMALLLKLDGHDVKMAHDGHAALEVARAFKPHMMLLDIGLPGLSGYDVARELRQDPQLRNVMLIALTGYGQAEDRIRSKAAGFDHHLIKPVDEEALESLLATVAHD